MSARIDARYLTPGCAGLIAFFALATGPALAADEKSAEQPYEPLTHATESIEDCMRKWDPGTHMTKEAWRETCQRIKDERSSYVKDR